MITDKQLKLYADHNPNGTMPRVVSELASEILELRYRLRSNERQFAAMAKSRCTCQGGR